MASFEAKAFKAEDINGGLKFDDGSGITPEAINAPIEAALLMQALAQNQPRMETDNNNKAFYVKIENNQFVFVNFALADEYVANIAANMTLMNEGGMSQ